MLELTADAKKELDAYFADKEKSPVRIYLAPGGCSGPRLSLALDDPNQNDATFEVEGYTFCMDKEMAQEATFLKVGISYQGFVVDSDLEIPAGAGGGSCGSSCGGCGSSGSCCS